MVLDTLSKKVFMTVAPWEDLRGRIAASAARAGVTSATYALAGLVAVLARMAPDGGVVVGATLVEVTDETTARDLLARVGLLGADTAAVDALAMTSGRSPHELAARVARLLDGIESALDLPVHRIELLSAEERTALVGDLTVPIEAPPYAPVYDVVAKRAREAPSAIAVRYLGAELTYDALVDQVDALAGALAHAGVQRGVKVAIAGQRGPGVVTAALAVLRAGGVLLMLDPALPVARRRVMIEVADARVFVAVGDSVVEPLLPFGDIVTIAVDAEGRLGAGARASVVTHVVKPDDPAYLFFTSGTTGTPKGVLGRHRGLSHFLTWQRERFAVGPRDRSAQLTGLSFDVVLRDIFLPLTSGATLCIPGPDVGLDGERVLGWMTAEGITLLHTIPSLARMWADERLQAHRPRLRWVFFAGEPLTDVLVERWRALFPTGEGLANFYGPTETTLAKCCFVVPIVPAPGVQPVGRPISHSQAFVWREGRICDKDETGEIVIRTPYRTLGYIGGTARDAARFFPNPFRDDPDDLLYRTGDRGMICDDGELRIFGRIDLQVKIRGVRVELAEVEAALTRVSGVRGAAVAAWTATGGDSFLAAYVVGDIAADVLREALRERLPEAMVPTAFAHLSRLPVNANGKLDRAALLRPDRSRDKRSQLPPSTETEKSIAEIWSRVLLVADVGRDDDFFSLGGQSLAAISVLAQVRTQLRRDLAIRDLFEAPVLRAFAARVDGASVQASSSAVYGSVPVEALARRDRLPLSSNQRRGLSLIEAGVGLAYLSMTFEVHGILDIARLRAAVRGLVQRHEVLRTRLLHEGASICAEPLEAPEFPFEFADLQGLDAADIDIVVDAARTRVRPDVWKGPMLGVGVFRRSVERWQVELVAAHLALDAQSRGIVARELSILYDAGTDARLPALSFQYADWAAWQSAALASPPGLVQVEHAREVFRKPFFSLPAHHERDVEHDEVLSGVIATDRWAGALTTIGTSPFVVALSGMFALFAAEIGTDEFIVHCSVAGREQPGTENLIGFFTSERYWSCPPSPGRSLTEVVEALRPQHEQNLRCMSLPVSDALGLPPRHNRAFNFAYVIDPPHRDRTFVRVPPLGSKSALRTPSGFDFAIWLRETQAGIEYECLYRPALYTRKHMERLLARYTRLLEDATTAPTLPMSELLHSDC